ncbi:MAG: prepilin-type N-terminal cleavage/methylation domain-containing protein [Phycisphaeraceae bacterium]|nr:prepilin-type N-terminal cleavage/methylation domain-containing protein [Phycisphaerae bacterium]MBX3392219.1 prepilin-type N-terminal cleavage/methylation domain-containing protein [Phycisphaeraceae bacterium]
MKGLNWQGQGVVMPRASWQVEAWRRRRGFSILELLIVVGILAAISAVAIPMLFSSGGRSSSAEDVVDVIDAAVAEARAKSARTGSSASVKLREDEGGLIRVVVAGATSRGSSRDGGPGALSSPSSGGVSDRSDVLVGVIRQSRVRPSTGKGDPASVPGKGSTVAGGIGHSGTGSEVMEDRTLVVLTPDGAVHPAGSAHVRLGSSGESVSLSVDEFGGVLLGMSGPPEELTPSPSRRTTGSSGG